MQGVFLGIIASSGWLGTVHAASSLIIAACLHPAVLHHRLNTREVRYKEKLVKTRNRLIEQLIQKDPSYKPPSGATVKPVIASSLQPPGGPQAGRA